MMFEDTKARIKNIDWVKFKIFLAGMYCVHRALEKYDKNYNISDAVIEGWRFAESFESYLKLHADGKI